MCRQARSCPPLSDSLENKGSDQTSCFLRTRKILWKLFGHAALTMFIVLNCSPKCSPIALEYRQDSQLSFRTNLSTTTSAMESG